MSHAWQTWQRMAPTNLVANTYANGTTAVPTAQFTDPCTDMFVQATLEPRQIEQMRKAHEEALAEPPAGPVRWYMIILASTVLS